MQTYIERAIPSVKNLGALVIQCEPGLVRIQAPLDVNRNHVGTAFGGSLNSLLTLSSWAWLFNKLKVEGYVAEVVIQKASTQYILPVSSPEIITQCKGPSEERWRRFYKVFQRRGLGRIELRAGIEQNGQLAAQFTGQFVASR